VEATYDEDDRRVRVTDDARQQLYDASGYGEPLDGNAVSLSTVEAAYLLSEGKLGDVDGDGYTDFVRRAVDDFAVLSVYTDLRDRGYYIDHGEELRLYRRGEHPANASAVGRVVVAREGDDVSLSTRIHLLAVADDDGDVTYFDFARVEPDGDFPEPSRTVRVEERGGESLVTDASVLEPPRYGASAEEGRVLSDVETAYLADSGFVDDGSRYTDGVDDRRLAVYTDLRDRGTCPRTGFKFGSDFRVYETTDDDHAGFLVSPLNPNGSLPVVELSRAVRLAHGVRKTAVFALVDDTVEYVAVERERP
jgi:tRNA-intron endonuclease